ncbi:RSP_7527 family protein [Jannaschia aquimarina]|uniref:Uncharacterized protein n=1 Tax=Jannaschia aquimarina TaxID=935700 RepID=A0A0D1EC15_9RHOB|nr:hypothetical protein [Jannaschia aquimarina]KIT14426.1 hypothetical protein jaqu_37140 [Jannaschia aquimarina]SNT29533.1 hypothetical protein SAMN05421775_11085 [Jannaschia aquimarina]
MTHHDELTIEMQARALRAQVFRDMILRLVARLRGAELPQPDTRTA